MVEAPENPRAEREAVDTWCIWTKTGRRPSFFHPTREKAEKEAARLAAKRPGKKFLVMQVVSKFGVPVEAPAPSPVGERAG